MILKQYEEYEDKLIEVYKSHSFFKQVTTFSDEQYIHYLLQLGHYSFQFINWLQTALVTLQNERAKKIVRYILSEELPPNKPTHHEERIADLQLIGVPLETALASQPTVETNSVITDRFDLIRYSPDHYDIRALVALRFDGEVLAGETFGQVVKELSRRFHFDTNKSRYYLIHFMHDIKGGRHERGGIGHADTYRQIISTMLVDDVALGVAQETMSSSLKMRQKFHDQF